MTEPLDFGRAVTWEALPPAIGGEDAEIGGGGGFTAAPLTAYASWQRNAPSHPVSGSFDFEADQADEDPTGSIGLVTMEGWTPVPHLIAPGLYGVNMRVFTSTGGPSMSGDWQDVRTSVAFGTVFDETELDSPRALDAKSLVSWPANTVAVAYLNGVVAVGDEPMFLSLSFSIAGVGGGVAYDADTLLNARLDVHRMA